MITGGGKKYYIFVEEKSLRNKNGLKGILILNISKIANFQ